MRTPEDTDVGKMVGENDLLREKLTDAMTPGFQAEFDPDEAERAGAFFEDALTEEDAIQSDVDLVHTVVIAE